MFRLALVVAVVAIGVPSTASAADINDGTRPADAPGPTSATEDPFWPEAQVTTCRAPTDPGDCGLIESYLKNHPQGLHASEARQLLEQAAPGLKHLRDRAAWQKANVTGCRSPRASSDCAGLAEYLDNYPEGAYAEAARKALDAAKPALKALKAEEAEEEALNQLETGLHELDRSIDALNNLAAYSIQVSSRLNQLAADDARELRQLSRRYSALAAKAQAPKTKAQATLQSCVQSFALFNASKDAPADSQLARKAPSHKRQFLDCRKPVETQLAQLAPIVQDADALLAELTAVLNK